MALRYLSTGTFPDLYVTVRGSIMEILASTGVEGTIAIADDAPGSRLEASGGLWYGDCGYLTTAQHTALVGAGVYGSLALNARASLNGSQVVWRGQGVGWVDESRKPDTLPVSSITAVYIGDSQTQGANIYFAGSNRSQVQAASPWPTYMAAASGGRITFLRNVGIGGQRSDQMLARFDVDVLSLDPDTVFIAASINNTGLSTLKPDIIEMVRRCRAYRSARCPSGVRPILVTTPPTGSYDGTYPASGGDAQKISDMNNWKREYAAANGLGLIDAYSFFVDPTGTYKNGATSTDAVHPSFAWQKLWGQFAWDSIKAMFTVAPPTLLPQANNDPNNLFTNAMLLPAQSARPSGWVAYGGGTMAESCGVVSGYRGNAFTAVNSGAGTHYYEKDTSLAGRQGHRLRLSFMAETSGLVGVGGFKWVGGSLDNQRAFHVEPTLSIPASSEFITELDVPSDATAIRLQIPVPAGATMKVAAIGIYDLTAIGAIV